MDWGVRCGEQQILTVCAITSAEGSCVWHWLYSALLNTVGDLSLEELMAKYGYVSQEQGEDTCDSSDEDGECSLHVGSGLCCVCACVCAD